VGSRTESETTHRVTLQAGDATEAVVRAIAGDLRPPARRPQSRTVPTTPSLFNSRGQILAPVILRGGVPDVLLRLAKRLRQAGKERCCRAGASMFPSSYE
jgi:hypothetical protein